MALVAVLFSGAPALAQDAVETQGGRITIQAPVSRPRAGTSSAPASAEKPAGRPAPPVKAMEPRLEERLKYEEAVRVFRKEGRARQAGEMLAAFLQMHPESPWAELATLELARVKIALNRPREGSRILSQMLETRPDTQLKREILLELARAYLALEDLREADRLVASAKEMGLSRELREEAERVLSAISAAGERAAAPPPPPPPRAAQPPLPPDRSRTVGVLLPLSGRARAYGEAALKGILVAFGFLDPLGGASSNPFTLSIRDTAGDPAQGAAAALDLAVKDQVIGIVGPLFSRVSLAAAEALAGTGIPLVSLSPDPHLVGASPILFRRSLTDAAQVEALVGYARTGMGLSSFALLYPETPYGNEMMNLFWDDLERKGGEVVAVEGFPPGQNDYGPQIRALASLNRELTPEEKALKAANKKWKLPPIIDFEAVFVPADYQTMGMLAPQLAYYDVTGILLLGTDGWNNPWLTELGEQHVEGAVISAGFFAGRPGTATRAFVDRYRLTFLEDPGTLAAQAYDAALIIRRGIEEGHAKDPDSLRQYISSLKGFPGAEGPLSAAPGGDIAQSVQLLMVRDGTFVAAPAPMPASTAEPAPLPEESFE